MKKLVFIASLLLTTLVGSSQSILLTDGAISELCSGFILDPGGNSNYGHNLNETHILKSNNGGQVKLNFVEFNLASGDKLKIYNGETAIGANLIGSYSGSTLLNQEISSVGDGSLTLVFTSNASGTRAGFKAEISCTFPCQDFDATITSDHVITPLSRTIFTCPGETITFNAEADFPNNNVNYSQSIGSSTISWLNTDNGATGAGFSFTLPITEAFSSKVILKILDSQNCARYDTVAVISACQPMDIALEYTTTVGTNTNAVPAHTGDIIFLADNTYPLDFSAEVTFPNESCYTQSLDSITWDFGHTGATGTSNEIDPPAHTFPNVNNVFYNITVEAKDQRGCKTQKKVKVYLGCQPLKFTYTATPGMLGDTIVACPGSVINIDVTTEAVFGDSLYTQDSTNLSFLWQTNGGTAAVTNQEDLNNLTYAHSGFYDVLLTVADTMTSSANPPQACTNTLHIPIMQYLEPLLSATAISTDTICLGDTIKLLGNSALPMPVYNAPPTYLPDGSGVSYTSTLTYDIFQPGSMIESADEVEEICLNMEHSYLGDLQMEIICPNGQSMILKAFSDGGGTYLGEPIDNEQPTDIGVGYEYCFTPNAPETMKSAIATGGYTTPFTDVVTGHSSSSLNAGEYLPEGDPSNDNDQNFDNLIGCPLNGDWTIKVTDQWGVDDGWIFDWHLMLRNMQNRMLPDTVQFPFGDREWTVQSGGPAEIITYFQDDAYAIPQEPGTYFFTYTLTTPANCNFDTTVGPIQVFPDINFQLSENINLCNTLEADIPGTLEGGTGTWTYTGPGNLVFTRTDTIPTHVTASATGAYTLRFTPNTDTTRCGESKSFIVNFRSLPEINVTIDSAKCYGQNDGIIRATAIGQDQPYTYQWSDGSPTATVVGLGAGVYHVTVNSQYCQDVFQYVVEQPFPLEAGEYGHVDNKCFGDHEGVAWAKTVGGTQPYTYQWSNGASTDSISNLATGSYTMTVTDANGCKAYVLQSVNGPSHPLKSLYAQVKNINCFGDDDGIIDISPSGGTQPYTYKWTHNGADFSTNGDLTDLDQGEYKLTITDANDCIFKTDTVITEPTELQLLQNTEMTSCNGVADGIAKVFAAEGVPPYVYNWSNGTHDSVAINLLSSYYNVTVVDAHGCSKKIENIFVDQPAPVIISLSTPDTICIGESATINISATSSPFTPYRFYWNGVQSPANVSVSPSVTTSYSAKVVDAHGCESQEAERIVNVFESFEATAAVFDKSEICKGDIVHVTLKPQGGNGEYTFMLADGSIVDTNFVVAPSTDGMIKVIISDNCTTPVLDTSFQVTVNNPYVASFHADENIGCQPFEVKFFQDTASHGFGTVYNWKMGYNEDDVEVSSEEPLPVHRFDSTGHYDITLEITTPKGCKSKTKEFSYINVYPKPMAQFSASTQEVSVTGPAVHFENESIGADTCMWIFGGADSTYTKHADFLFPPEADEYEVMLISETNYGCKDTAYTVIVVKNEITLYMPTAFTPNGDGKNDKFLLKGNGIESYKIQVFDRWGNIIYTGNNLDEGWDGTNSKTKKAMSPGSYSFYLEFVDTDGKKHKKNGKLTLIR